MFGKIKNAIQNAIQKKDAVASEKIHLEKGKFEHDAGNFTKAIEYCDKVLEINPENEGACGFKGTSPPSIDEKRSVKENNIDLLVTEKNIELSKQNKWDKESIFKFLLNQFDEELDEYSFDDFEEYAIYKKGKLDIGRTIEIFLNICEIEEDMFDDFDDYVQFRRAIKNTRWLKDSSHPITYEKKPVEENNIVLLVTENNIELSKQNKWDKESIFKFLLNQFDEELDEYSFDDFEEYAIYKKGKLDIDRTIEIFLNTCEIEEDMFDDFDDYVQFRRAIKNTRWLKDYSHPPTYEKKSVEENNIDLIVTENNIELSKQNKWDKESIFKFLLNQFDEELDEYSFDDFEEYAIYKKGKLDLDRTIEIFLNECEIEEDMFDDFDDYVQFRRAIKNTR